MQQDQNSDQEVLLYASAPLLPGAGSVSFEFSPPATPDKRYYPLWEQDEPDLQFFILGFPRIISALFEKVEISYPNCWIGVNILTRILVGSNWDRKPGDIDFVVGRLREDGAADLTYLVGYQVKVCRVDADDAPKIDSLGTGQARGTAELGFDRTVLLHITAQEEKSLPTGYASSWSGLQNVPEPAAYNRLFGKVRARMDRETSRWPFGYVILGCGQIERSDPRLGGVFSPRQFVDPPAQPFRDSTDVNRYRHAIERSLQQLIGNRYTAPRRPLYLYSRKNRPTPRIDLPETTPEGRVR